jgi:hypothetical protein
MSAVDQIRGFLLLLKTMDRRFNFGKRIRRFCDNSGLALETAVSGGTIPSSAAIVAFSEAFFRAATAGVVAGKAAIVAGGAIAIGRRIVAALGRVGLGTVIALGAIVALGVSAFAIVTLAIGIATAAFATALITIAGAIGATVRFAIRAILRVKSALLRSHR